MDGLLEVIESEEMFEKEELSKEDSFENDKFRDKKIMRFRKIDDAVNFARGFVFNYLIPKYGRDKAVEFPMAKSEPQRIAKSQEEASLEMERFLGIAPEDPNREVWLVIAKERYPEVQEYIDSLGKV